MWSDERQRTKGWVSSDAIGKMFTIDAQGRLQLNIGGSLFIAPDGSVRIRTGSTLVEGPGSPIELNSEVSRSTVTKAVATVEASVSALDTRTTALIVANQSELADHESRITTLESSGGGGFAAEALFWSGF